MVMLLLMTMAMIKMLTMMMMMVVMIMILPRSLFPLGNCKSAQNKNGSSHSANLYSDYVLHKISGADL